MNPFVVALGVLAGLAVVSSASRAKAREKSAVERILGDRVGVPTSSPRPEMEVYDVTDAGAGEGAYPIATKAVRKGLAVVVPAHFFRGIVDRPGVPNRLFVLPPSLVSMATQNGYYREWRP